MIIPHIFLDSNDIEINAFQVGLDIIPRWGIDSINSRKIELLNKENGIEIKIGNKIAKCGDYVLSIDDKLSIMAADEFEKDYLAKTIKED